MEKDLYDSINEYVAAENVIDISENPVTSGLLESIASLLPILGTVMNHTLKKGLADYQNSKREQLLNSILEYKGIIASKEINSIPFLIEYARTQEVVDRMTNNKKVQYLCNLFTNYFILENHKDDMDEYEEYLNQIQVLSYRELKVLVELYKLEEKYMEKGEKDTFAIHQKACMELKNLVEESMQWSPGLLEGVLNSISKSGFCKEETGARFSYAGGVFGTTEYFKRFYSYIIKR